MPTTPGVDLTDAQWTRVRAAFAAKDPTKTPVQNFQDAQRRWLIQEVVTVERQQREVAFQEEQRLRDAQAITDLGGTLPPTT